MLTIITIWLCRCGARLKVLAEAVQNEPCDTWTVSCPHCGDLQEIRADRIVSIAEANAALTFEARNAG